jgi:hypothetical protein
MTEPSSAIPVPVQAAALQELAERWRARAEWIEARTPAAADAYRRAAAELEAVVAPAAPRADPAQFDLLSPPNAKSASA